MDPMSGYFMFRREVLERTRLNSMGYKILLEVLAKGRCEPVVEIPYTFRRRYRGKSKLRFKEFVSFIYLLFRLKVML